MRNRFWRLLASAGLSGFVGFSVLASATGASAQTSPRAVPSVSRPVIQATSSDRQRLNAALSRLARNPQDVSALLDAGDAARSLNDFAASIGFYLRADETQPNDPRIKAGLGSALAMSGDAVSAIPYFAAAEQAGALPSLIASDRGLAYDLVGDSAAAQRYYHQALGVTTGPAQDQVRNRLAISQAITGQLNTAQTTLMPLLNKQDKPGWRTRAFILAIGGQITEAVDTTNKILPPQLAENIAPYLRYMPRLTRAQQAAAANLGRFPRASEIGRDDPRIAAYVSTSRVAAAGSGLIPKGEPLGVGGKTASKARPARETRESRAEVARLAREKAASSATSGIARDTKVATLDPERRAPPEPRPTIERTGGAPDTSRAGELPPVGGSRPVPASQTPAPTMPTPQRSTATPPTMPAPTSRVASAASPAPPSPGFDLSSLPASTSAPRTVATPASTPITAPAQQTETPPAPRPAITLPSFTPPASAAPAAQVAGVTAPSTPPPVPGPGQLSLTEIFSDLGKPTLEAMPAAGAVDIRAVAAVRPKPVVVARAEEADAPPPPETKGKGARSKAELAKAEATKAETTKAQLIKDKAAKAAADKEKAEKEKAKKPSHPSRIWVQIGVGRDKDAIAFDWRRWTRQSPALFKGRTASTTDMGRTNRVLVGPFATLKAANTFVADAKKAGFDDVLPWTSPAGQVVDSLSAK